MDLSLAPLRTPWPHFVHQKFTWAQLVAEPVYLLPDCWWCPQQLLCLLIDCLPAHVMQ